MTNIRGGLFPADKHEFDALLNKPRGPSLQLPSPEEMKEADRLVNGAIREKVRRAEFEQQRVELPQVIASIAYDELVIETQRSYGTESTRSTYKSDFGSFQNWCNDNEYPSLPSSPEIVAIYLLTRAKEGAQPARLQRMVSAVKFYHNWANHSFDHEDVQIKAVQRFIRRCADEQKEIEQENKPTTEPEPPTINGSGGHH
jgi:hypothetical protein